MVDWMCEVMNIAFKNTCTDQTYFLAVNLLDRYIQSFEARSEVFKAQDLHVSGVACMFIASKYEDIHPLLMKTVFQKIGHSKIPEAAILAREKDILRSLGFCIGAAPTPLEFIQNYFEIIPQLRDHQDK